MADVIPARVRKFSCQDRASEALGRHTQVPGGLQGQNPDKALRFILTFCVKVNVTIASY